MCECVCCSWRQTLSVQQNLRFIRSRHQRILCNSSDLISPTHSRSFNSLNLSGVKIATDFLSVAHESWSQIERKRLHQCHSSCGFFLLFIVQKISYDIYLISCKMKCVTKNANNLKLKWKSICCCWYFIYFSTLKMFFNFFSRPFIDVSWVGGSMGVYSRKNVKHAFNEKSTVNCKEKTNEFAPYMHVVSEFQIYLDQVKTIPPKY